MPSTVVSLDCSPDILTLDTLNRVLFVRTRLVSLITDKVHSLSLTSGKTRENKTLPYRHVAVRQLSAAQCDVSELTIVLRAVLCLMFLEVVQRENNEIRQHGIEAK